MLSRSGPNLLLAAWILSSCTETTLESDGQEPTYSAVTRDVLIESLWSVDGLPGWLPDQITVGAADARYDDFSNLESMDLLEIEMDYGLRSVVFHLHPEENALNRLVIYHQGHAGHIDKGRRTIERLLNAGYAVLGFAMPLLGPNAIDAIRLPSGTAVTVVVSHADLDPLEQEGVNVHTFFVEPVIVGLNYIESDYDYDSIDMTGLSGGGWTTSLAAAIDPRIERSYPVAGGLPLHVRNSSDSQDFEQLAERPAFDVATYLDWYYLGGLGDGRRQMQTLNLNDPCCFAAAGREAIIQDYVDEIVAAGSDFDVFVDSEHVGHEVSVNALDVILADMAR
jgi:cephalosporin-C deacetylase-like acetyl esterase